MTEATKSLHQRLAAVMARVDYVQKEKKQGMRYSIVTHDAVTAKVRPILLEEGVLYYPHAMHYGQNGNRTEVSMVVRFANVDDALDFIDVPTLGFGIDDQDKGPGKAISYAVKYALLKALGLETGDDPDTEQNAVHKPAQPVMRAVDVNTGEILPPRGNPAQAASDGLRDAWLDGVLDSLDADASPRQKAEAFAAQLEKDFKGYKSRRGLEQYWSKRERVLERLASNHTDLFESLIDIYNVALRSFDEEPIAAEMVRTGTFGG